MATPAEHLSSESALTDTDLSDLAPDAADLSDLTQEPHGVDPILVPETPSPVWSTEEIIEAATRIPDSALSLRSADGADVLMHVYEALGFVAGERDITEITPMDPEGAEKLRIAREKVRQEVRQALKLYRRDYIDAQTGNRDIEKIIDLIDQTEGADEADPALRVVAVLKAQNRNPVYLAEAESLARLLYKAKPKDY